MLSWRELFLQVIFDLLKTRKSRELHRNYVLLIPGPAKSTLFSNDITGNQQPSLAVSVSENISHAGRFEFEFECVLAIPHLFTKLHAKSTNTRETYCRMKYCQTLPFPPSSSTTYSQTCFAQNLIGNFYISLNKSVEIRQCQTNCFKTRLNISCSCCWALLWVV